MKKLKLIQLLALAIFIVSSFSCEKKLEPKFYDRLALNNFPKTAEDITAAVTGVYESVMPIFGDQIEDPNWFLPGEALTDEFWSAKRGGTWLMFHNLTWVSSSIEVVGVYTPFVKGITQCQNTIAVMEKVEMDESLKSRYRAELHGITALLAYYLYDYYGPTAIVTDPSITLDPNSKFKPKRPTAEWMVNFIKEEARAAADNLPVEYSNADYGRITKGAALMVLLKLAMHEKNWNDANDISDEIINLGYYHLQESYYSIFTVDNEMNNEIILAIPMTASGKTGPAGQVNEILNVILPNCVLPDGRTWSGYSGYYKVPWEMYDKFEPGDDRLKNLWNTLPTYNGIINLRSNTTNIYFYSGAIPYKYPIDPNGTLSKNGNDVVIYRYADVLLSKAEALNNLNGPNQESIDLINMVRNRAKTTPIELAQYNDKQALSDFILDERFRELFFEGHRRTDLIRNGKFLSEAAKRGAPVYDEHLLLFPIPQAVIDENHNIEQNDKY